MAGQTRIDGNLIDTGTDPNDILSVSTGDGRYPKLNGPNTLTGDLNVDSGTLFVDSDNGRVGVGTTSPSSALTVAGTITSDRINAGSIVSAATLEWNSATDSYTRESSLNNNVSPVHEGMKRCLLLDDGTVNYYLDPNDSTLKEDGTSADLSGTDGQVMVEIPKFYFRFEFEGNKRIWKVSDLPIAGYQLHPAFFKNGKIVDYRYMGAYHACVYDDSADTYIAGLNLDENIGNVDLGNDKLASVSGIYPMVGLERYEFRALAANRGAGWRQQDFWLISAVQMLYLVEYGDFNSQANLGDGNVNGSYTGSSSNQNDSPQTVAGASNGFGNASTDGSQPSAGSKPGTAYMSYRGIENFYGNCWSLVDGVNISVGTSGTWYVNNDDTTFADNTATNYELIADSMPSDGYVTDIVNEAGAFIPASTGGSSSTFLANSFYDDNGNTNRVPRFGGHAGDGSRAGAFFWDMSNNSSADFRNLCGRLSF